MAKKRKVVFFIVEGISDQTALAAIISKIIKTEEVVVEFMRGDITTETGVSPSNIASKIGNFVKEYSKLYSFRALDFLEVIHLIDTDGAFIGEDKVMEAEVDGVIYESDIIKATNSRNIIDRNRRKSENVDKLISLSKVWGIIPYSVYFFSCNLEHVLHDEPNTPWKDKDKMATQFAKKYRHNPEDFLAFIKSPFVAIEKTYSKSWDYIKEDENSLKRHTNLNLIFSEHAKNIHR